MGQEINLLNLYPRSNRDVDKRRTSKTVADQNVARQFGKEFFDGDRSHGYGGFYYHPRFWSPVVPALKQHFNLCEGSSVLDVGCAKGFMLFDIARMIPGVTIRGIDISAYAIENALPEVANMLTVGDASALPLEKNCFDAVISITTVHNLERDDCGRALQEIERVSRGKSFVTVDAYRNDEERELMESWNLTAKTMMHVEEWKQFFDDVGYTGDYYWFIP